MGKKIEQKARIGFRKLKAPILLNYEKGGGEKSGIERGGENSRIERGGWEKVE